MKPPFERVSRFIERHSMLDGVSGIVVAVSGGADSVALLEMLMRLLSGVGGWGLGVTEEELARTFERQVKSHSSSFTDPQSLSPGPRLHVAHLDHMLRGRASAEDAEFVRALADSFGLAVSIGSVDVRATAEVRVGGIEETAREIRYDFLLGVAGRTGCDRIAVGHTMTDQAETFLMRLIRGAGLRGLSAMRPVAAVPAFAAKTDEGRERETGRGGEVAPSPRRLVAPPPLLIRPLLCITREEVEAYCRERGLEFRTDATNLSLHYTRNRIRNEVLPALEAINPQVVKSIARAVDNLASDQDVLDNLASELLDQARLQSSDLKRIHTQKATAYSVAALLEHAAGMRRRLIIEAIRLARSAAYRKKRLHGEVVSSHVTAVEGLLEPKSSGRHINLPGLEVWREFDVLVLKPILPAGEEAPYQCSISSESPYAEAGGFSFTLQRGVRVELLKSVMEEAQRERRRIARDWMVIALDDNGLPDPLMIRPRQPGERTHVKGQRKTIKLKNLMIDHRIPCSRRANWPLVTTPDGRYVWSPGLPPALEFAAGDETQGLAIMRASSI